MEEMNAVISQVQEVKELAARPITDQASYQEAAETLKACKAIQKRIESIYTPLVKHANDAVKAIRDEMKKHLDPVLAIDAELRRSTSVWIAEQERIKREEEIRRAAEAKAERERLEAEREQEADFLAEIGLADTPIPVVIPEPVAAIDQAGISYREVWKFEITDVNLIPREYMLPDEAGIGKVVRAMKQLAVIPGIRVYSEKSAVVR